MTDFDKLTKLKLKDLKTWTWSTSILTLFGFIVEV